MLERRTRLAPMSAKRRQQLAEQGNTNPFSTLPVGAPLNRAEGGRFAAALDRKPAKNTGPDAATVALVIERDRGCCVRCGKPVAGGVRGLDFSLQHRRARGAGGSRREDTNSPAALILLCGSATTGCHHHVESHRAEARDFGWAIRQSDNPALMPVLHAVHGWVILTPAGGFTAHSPNHTSEVSA
ncbi:hypothetical protein MED01_002337 [Micromonospora sp. MED01]|uniref:hypothetical protein n=1 Tax=Micromonospora alfalfae TaxID=2911212 RepID=UPI001EE908DE|nr:hypothetical protein [Micromonospora alfalfae]MCG5464172.1 hypothetical protein [Micromonospora alfalfae]